VEAAEAAVAAEAAAEAAAAQQKAALAALMAGKAAEEAKEASAAQRAASRIAARVRGQKARRPSKEGCMHRPLFVPKGVPAVWAPLCKVSSAPVLLPAARLLALISQIYEAKMVSDAACEKEKRPKPPFEQLAHFTLQCEGAGQASSSQVSQVSQYVQ